MNRKKIFFGCSVALGVLIIFSIGGGYYAYRCYFSPMMSASKIPEAFKTPGVLTGSGFLSKKVFFQNLKTGAINDIVFRELNSGHGQEIVIAGTKGAVFLDDRKNVKSSVFYNVRAGHVDIVDVEGDNIYEYLDRGGGWQDVSLIDNNGSPVWSYSGSPAVNDTTAGDIDGDGVLEFVLGFNGGGGVRLLDRKGKEKWTQGDGNVWHVEMVDTDGNGSLEIVHSNAAGELTVRDAKGAIVARSKPATYFTDFSLTPWPKKSSKKYALCSDNGDIWVVGFNGRTAAQYKAPLSECFGHARGIPVKVKSDIPEFFAVVVEYSNWEKSLLYIYGQNKTLVYHEILPEACSSISSISVDSKGQEVLLVGCNGKVWEYALTNSESN